jgi:hypothetical protein
MRSFLRLHRAFPLVVAITSVALLAPILRHLATGIDVSLKLLPEMVLIPTLVASLMGETIATPMAEIEGTVVRGHRVAVLVFGLAITLFAATALGIAFGGVEGVHSWRSVLRNVLGLTGSAFISSAWLGGWRAFLLPVAIGLGFGTSIAASSGRWHWLLAGDRDSIAWVMTFFLLMAGVGSVIVRAPIPRQ